MSGVSLKEGYQAIDRRAAIMIKRAGLVLLVAASMTLAPLVNSPVGAQSPSPRITLAYLEHKKLVVQGLNFQPGAVVLINGLDERTTADPDDPAKLIVKKGKKKLAGLTQVDVQVRNPDGQISDGVDMNHPRTVTLADNGDTINLSVGDGLFVYLGTTYDWSFSAPYDTNVLAPVPGVGTLIVGAQALLVALNPGQTTLTLSGDPPCRNSTPPCEAPSLQFQITVIVQ